MLVIHLQCRREHDNETQDNDVFNHDEADTTMIFYVLKAKRVICVFSEDRFVQLVYWLYRAAVVQIANGTVG